MVEDVLVADDDPVSARFLADALALAGRSCTHARDGGEALALARARRFSLLVLDLCMPVRGGEALLRELRADADAASHDVRAVAVSGEIAPGQTAALRAAGFAGVLRKPLRVDEVAALFGELRDPAQPAAPAGDAPVLDDEAALRATGSDASLRGLRELFEAELPQQLALLRAAHARGDAGAQHDIAHRMQAGCRFCGTLALDAALTRHRRDMSARTLADLEHAAALTLEALSR